MLYTAKKNQFTIYLGKIKTEFSAYHWNIDLSVLLCKCQMCFEAILKLISAAEYFAKVSKQCNEKWGLHNIKKQRRFFSKKLNTVFFIDVTTIINPSLI